MLSKLWVTFLVISVITGIYTGRMPQVTAAATKGATEAVSIVISIVGIMSFWSGMMELISSSGAARKLSSLLQPILRPLFADAAQDRKAMELVSANITANLLGLSNAATPIGLQAIDRLYTLNGRIGTPDTVLTLITLNTASIQLIPSTVAALRASNGAAQPFVIMPAVWAASALSVAVVICAARVLRKFM